MRINHTPDPDDVRSLMAAQLADPFFGEALFDHLPDIVYFVKDVSGRYVVVNQTLVQRVGAGSKEELIGRTSDEVFAKEFGGRFLEQDLAVIESRAPLIAQLEQHAYPSGQTGWCLTTKLPIMGHDGDVIGVVGMSRDLQSPGEDTSELNQLARVVDFIEVHLGEPLRTSDLAEHAELTAYALDRNCRQVYGISPSQLILQLRMSAAETKLRQSSDAIVSIALAVGYSDQSAFTRQFRRTFGMSPGKYREQNQL